MKAETASKSWRHFAFEQLDPSARTSSGLSAVNTVLVVAIILGVIAAILETEAPLYRDYRPSFELFETALAALFSLEFVARLWAAGEAPGPQSVARKRLSFLFSLTTLLDLLVIFAALAPFVTSDLTLLRIVRLIRIARLAKLGRLNRAAEHLHYAVSTRAYELLLAVSLAFALLIAGASALYWAEGDIQPDKFGSIPRALWWSAVTLTTIGYGDVSPVTPIGKFIAVIVAIGGIGLVALPTGILASGFSEAVQRNRRDDA